MIRTYGGVGVVNVVGAPREEIAAPRPRGRQPVEVNEEGAERLETRSSLVSERHTMEGEAEALTVRIAKRLALQFKPRIFQKMILRFRSIWKELGTRWDRTEGGSDLDQPLLGRCGTVKQTGRDAPSV